MTIRIRTLSDPYYQGTKALDGANYLLTIRWNTNTEKFYLDLKGLNNDIDVKGIALLPGKDLLSPFGYSWELGELWVVDNTDGNENPNYDDMGTRWTLEYTPK